MTMIKTMLMILTSQFVINNKLIVLYLISLIKFFFILFIESIFFYFSIFILLLLCQIKLISIINNTINIINNKSTVLSWKDLFKKFIFSFICFNLISIFIYIIFNHFVIYYKMINFYLLILISLIIYITYLFKNKYWQHKKIILKILLFTWVFGILMRSLSIIFFSIFLNNENILLLSLNFNILNYLFPLLFSNMFFSFPIKNIINDNIFYKNIISYIFPIYKLDSIESIINNNLRLNDGSYLPAHNHLIESIKKAGIINLDLTQNQKKVLLNLFHTLNVTINYENPNENFTKNLLCGYITTNKNPEKWHIEMAPFTYQFRHKGDKLSIFNLQRKVNLGPFFTFNIQDNIQNITFTIENILTHEGFGNNPNTLVVYSPGPRPTDYEINEIEIYLREDLEDGCDMIGIWEENDFIYLKGTEIKYEPSDQEHELQELDFVIGGIRHKVPNFKTQLLDYSQPSRVFRHWHGSIPYPYKKFGMEVSY